MRAMIQGRLGFDLCFPEDEILIKALLRLHRLDAQKVPPAVQWGLVFEAPYDAMICDADSRFLAQQANCRSWPILRLASHGRRHSGLNCLPRPISADALYAWLGRIADAMLHTQSVPAVPPVQTQTHAGACCAPAPSEMAAVAARAVELAPVPAQVPHQAPALQAECALLHDQDDAGAAGAAGDAREEAQLLELDHTAYYQLKQWPPASLLRNEHKSVRIASLLSRHPLRIKDISSIAGATKAQCEQFLRKLMDIHLLKRCSQDEVERALSQKASRFISKAQAAEGQSHGVQESACHAVAASADKRRASPSESRGFISSLRKKLGLVF